MAEYKIVACDLDGTLLDSNGNTGEENFCAISKLAEKNVWFVPASGRSFTEIPYEIKDCKDIRYFICSSGAVVFDKFKNERISFCFPRDLSKKIFNLLFAADCHLTVRHFGKMYTDAQKMNEDSFFKYKVWGPHASLLKDVGEAIDGFEEKFSNSDDIEMISIFIGDDKRLQTLKEELSLFSDVNVASACPYNIELTYKKAGKGNALAALADKLGVSIDQTIAVGDSENDIPMVSFAGLGLAMSNSTDELKKHADKTVCTNNEHVVQYILNEFIV